MEQLTGISAHRDIEGPYKALMDHLDTNQFKDKMKADESLWIKDDLADEQPVYLTTEQEIDQMLID